MCQKFGQCSSICKFKVQEIQLEDDLKINISIIESLNIDDDLKDQVCCAILRHNESFDNSDVFFSLHRMKKKRMILLFFVQDFLSCLLKD